MTTYADQLAAIASQLAPIGAAADTTIAMQNTENVGLTAEAATLTAQVATLTAELAALQATPPVVVIPPVVTPPPSVTPIVFVDTDFESSSTFAQAVAPLYGPGKLTTSPVASGTQAVEQDSPAGGSTNYLSYRFANNAPLTTRNPNGVFIRFSVALDQAMLDNARTSGQCKLFLGRYLDWNSTPGAVAPNSQPGCLMLGVGEAFFGEGGTLANQIVAAMDDNIVIVPGSPTGVVMTALQYVKIQVWVMRDPATNTGYCKLWIWDPATAAYVLKVDVTHVDDAVYKICRNSDGPYDHFYAMLPTPYANVAGKCYTDRVKIANFFIPD